MRLITSVTAGAVARPGFGNCARGATNISAPQSTIKYSKTSTAASGFGNYARATSSVVYDPATDTYTVRDTGSLTTSHLRTGQHLLVERDLHDLHQGHERDVPAAQHPAIR